MADLIPSGFDNSTGQKKKLTSSDSLVDSSGATITGNYPPGFISGMQVIVESGGDTDILVEPGVCRDRDNTTNLSLSARATIDITLGHASGTGLPQANGIDEIGLDNLSTGSITCSQTGTTITATGAIYSSTEGDGLFTPYDPIVSSTMSTTGTAFTASAGAEIDRSIAVGDLVGSSTRGWSRVVSVDSSTTATLVAALPGGNASTEAWSIIHNATIWPGTVISDRQRINTLSSTGTSIVVGNSTTIAASSALTIGILARFPGDPELIWLAVWRASNGNCYASTQHISMLGFAPGTVRQRMVGWAAFNDDDDLQGVYYQNGGPTRRVQQEIPSATSLSTTASFSGNLVSGTSGIGVPRTAQYASMSIFGETDSGEHIIAFRARGRGLGSGSAGLSNAMIFNGNASSTVHIDMPIDGAGYFDSRVASGTWTTAESRTTGFIDDLDFPINDVA